MRGRASLLSERRYRRLFLIAVFSISAVALAPLLIMTWANHRQYAEAFREEQTRPLVRFVANGKLSLESFLEARIAALDYILAARDRTELQRSETLNGILQDMQATFGGFVDLGVIDDTGIQVAYAGPFDLAGRDYREAPWFQEVISRGTFVSDVFLGLRGSPHFVIALFHEVEAGQGYVLRATIDTDFFNRLVRHLVPEPGGDVFLQTQEGILQTPSSSHGGILEAASIQPLPFSTQTEVLAVPGAEGRTEHIAYAPVEGSPFSLVIVSPSTATELGWASLRRNLLVFLGVSVVLILSVIIWGSTWAVKKAKEADLIRASALHRMEYQNKMAALGRLSAGVAHEINNPISIVSQNAGLLKDLFLMSERPPPKERVLSILDSVLGAAERCGGITHRLLGFAKHMQVQPETIDLGQLLVEVLGFLEKEAEYRAVRVETLFPDGSLTIVSDRGQLQQVFLNIINNAFAAVDEGGQIQIGMEDIAADSVAVWIQDDGVGIPQEHLSTIFDPFFSTKKGAGTGLGLSITYGIVQKLGGEVTVKSRVGEGSRFIVTLPKGSRER